MTTIEVPLPPTRDQDFDWQREADYALEVSKMLEPTLRRIDTPGVLLQMAWPVNYDEAVARIAVFYCNGCANLHRRFSLDWDDESKTSESWLIQDDEWVEEPEDEA